MISHIVFDCDGVLVDSEPLSMAVDYELLAENGVSLSPEEVSHRFIGLTFAALVAAVEREFGITLPAGLEAEKDRRLAARFTRELQPVAGVADLLERLDLPLSIASNSKKARVALALELTGLNRFFGNRISSFEETRHGKPAPDVYLLAAARAGQPPERCLAVEDSVAGVTSALAAGFEVVGFTGAYHDANAQAQRLAGAGAAQIVAEMSALTGAIARFG